MKNIWKRMALILSVLCLTLGCAAFAACGEEPDAPDDTDDTDTGTTYTVTVVDPDGNPIQNAGVAFCSADEEFCTMPYFTDANGVVTASTSDTQLKDHVEDEYLVHVVSASGSYQKTTSGSSYFISKDGKYLTSEWDGNSYTYVLVAAE